MKVREYQEKDFEPLFSYWKHLGEKVPYFFPVSPAKWRECLFEDKLDHEKMFSWQETIVALENDRIIGFIQYGQPAFAWDEKGQKYRNPQIGMIRHFYFEEGRFDAAGALLAKSEGYLSRFPNQHAFYHIFGMSCNAYHGKLHQSLAHIDRFLREQGYRIEHENVYYSLELDPGELAQEQELQLVSTVSPEPDTQNHEVCLWNHLIGTIQVRYLDRLTGGLATDIAYLTWIEIARAFRGQGWGTRSIESLIGHLRSQKYHELHLDTASTNQVAQRFYERLGFQNRGKTRSYFKSNCSFLLDLPAA